jgi:hypothetical protein
MIKIDIDSRGSTKNPTMTKIRSNFRGYKEPFNLKLTLDAPWNPP